MAEWYYQFMGETVGPLSAKELKSHAADGRIPAEALVRQGTDGKWVSSQRVRGLEAPQPAIPPPPVSNVDVRDVSTQSKKPADDDPWHVSISNFVQRAWPIATLIIASLVWISAANSYHGKSGFWAYPAIIAASIAITALLARRWSRRLVFAGTAIVTLVLLVYWGRTDTYTETWVNGTIEYSDKYNRWSRQHVYRSMLCCESEEKARDNPWLLDAQWIAEGPIAGIGKPHGKWEYTTYFWGREPAQLPRTEFQFYWYGEQVSEGEWHLRNRN
jgi:hypothetical protein